VEKLEPLEAASVREADTVAAALGVMRSERIGCLLVTDADERITGIFTERDVLTRVAAEGLDPVGVTLREVMTPNPETVKPDHPLAHVVHLMMVGDLRYLPLVDDRGRAVGVITSRGLIDYIASLVIG
jgi:CBS domain-containing protein